MTAQDDAYAAGAAAQRERDANLMDDLAACYPIDVFPPATGLDATGGAAMRFAYLNAARTIREEPPSD